MPFDEETKRDFVPKVGLKQQAGQASMFDNKPKQPTQQEFEQQVQVSQERLSGYKKRAAELFLAYDKALNDKTLPQNRNTFIIESEREIMTNMIQLAIEVNGDPTEEEGMGSLTWIACLLKTCLSQRDRINELEYSVSQFQKKMSPTILAEFIGKEIAKIMEKKA